MNPAPDAAESWIHKKFLNFLNSIKSYQVTDTPPYIPNKLKLGISLAVEPTYPNPAKAKFLGCHSRLFELFANAPEFRICFSRNSYGPFSMSSSITDWSIIADTSKNCYSFTIHLKFCDLEN